MYWNNAEVYSEDAGETARKGWNNLFHYRWRGIPRLLRSITGLAHERDIETLLDNAGYTASFIAEELIHLIDSCFTSGDFSKDIVDSISRAYGVLEAISCGDQNSICEPLKHYTGTGIHFQIPPRAV